MNIRIANERADVEALKACAIGVQNFERRFQTHSSQARSEYATFEYLLLIFFSYYVKNTRLLLKDG